MAMLWVKVAHIVMVMAWMVGIFYLPRIFVHYVEGKAAGEDVRRLEIMAQKLFKFMTVMSLFALVSGLALWLHFGIGKGMGWIHAKLAMVLLMAVYHVFCGHLLKKISNGNMNWSGIALRWFNELPLFMLVTILYFVVLKPF